MIILENMCAEVTSRWYIESVVKKEETVWVRRPLAFCVIRRVCGQTFRVRVREQK